MPINLTQAEIDALNAEYCKLDSSIVKRQEAVDAQDDVVQAATDADNAEKKVFNFYDGAIIKRYEDEKEQLTGEYTDAPVTTAELDDLGQLNPTNRMFPPIGTSEPVRITEFDGGGLVTTDNEIPSIPGSLDIEPYWITRQIESQDWLVNGFSGTTPPISGTMRVDDLINQSTTQITISSTGSTETFNFQVGDTFLVISGAQQIGVRVTNVVSQEDGDPLGGFCTPTATPDTEAQCTIEGGTWTSAPVLPEAVLDIEVLTLGSVAANGTLNNTWAGFNNTERTNKVATFQYLLDNMILGLEAQIDNRLTKLGIQKTSLEANEDTSLDPQALIDVDSAITFLNAWKVSTDVDDTELSSLTSETTTRSTQITARITAIDTDKAAQHDLRYGSATNIGDTSRGTARIKFFRIDSQSTTADLKAIEEARQQAIVDTLTLAGEPIPVC